MDPKPSRSTPETESQPLEDYVEVEFRADALVKFNELFTPREQSAVLELLVQHADEGVEVEKLDDIPVRLLTLFKVRFRFKDLSDIGKLIILSLEGSNNDAPPPNHKKWQDPLISGGVSGLVRWLLGQIMSHVQQTPRIATVNGWRVRGRGFFISDRRLAKTLGVRR